MYENEIFLSEFFIQQICNVCEVNTKSCLKYVFIFL